MIAVTAKPRLRRIEGAVAAGPQGPRAATGRRVRQRLRADRDEFDDRRADPRRPPRGAGRLGSRGGPAAGFGRSTGARASKCRSATRMARCCRQGRPVNCSFAATRCRAATPGSARCSTPRVVPDQGHRHPRRGRLPVHRRAQRRHHHPGRGEHRARRAGGRAGRAPARA